VSASIDCWTISVKTETAVMDGVVVIDKPAGWTSHDVVAKIRNLTRVKKVGHTGTLDPFATGVLPLTLGRATRLTDYFVSSDKVYRGVMRFGFATATYDIDGEALGEDTQPRLEPDRLREIFSRYLGTLVQTIPPYSAKKIHGKPMYAYARQGLDVGSATKQVTIKSLQLLSVDGSEAEFELSCAAGTYARSLAHDIGRDYGCGAHLIRLRRTRSGEFPVEDATPLGDGANFYPGEYFLGRIIPMRLLLNEIPAIVVSPNDQSKLLRGMDLNLLTTAFEASEVRLTDENGALLALGRRMECFPSPADQPVRWVRIHPRATFG
jgi:tRNA pseudouridine55 synthase